MATDDKKNGTRKKDSVVNAKETFAATEGNAKKDSGTGGEKNEDAPSKDGAPKKEKTPLDVVASSRPSLEELAARVQSEAPNAATKQSTATANTTIATKGATATTTTPTAADEAAADGSSSQSSSNLDDIAASAARSRNAQAQSIEYRIPGQQAGNNLRSLYQNPIQQGNDPASIYRPSGTAPLASQYQSIQKQEQERHVINNYERESLQRSVGKTAADELLEQHKERLHGDKGIFSTYNKR